MYTYEQLRAIAAGVQARHGWDYGVVCDDRAPVPWDYEAYTAALLHPGQRVLDIGMGGAESCCGWQRRRASAGAWASTLPPRWWPTPARTVPPAQQQIACGWPRCPPRR